MAGARPHAYQRRRHSVSLLYAHVVVVVKYRRRVLTPRHHAFLVRLWSRPCQEIGAHVVECNGEADHIHLLLLHPPSVALATVVGRLKGRSA